MKWTHTIGEILADNWSTVQDIGLNGHQLRHLNNISRCHTSSLGGTLLECQKCGHHNYIFHSCRNRHCPSCQGSKIEDWIKRQQSYLLDVPYYHVVFTMPSDLNQLCLHKPRIMYDVLFKASWKTLQIFAADQKYLGATSGMTAVLHTWSQNLGMHPHLHCIVPGGGLTKNGKWKTTRSKGKYLFPTKAMAIVYRAIFLAELIKLSEAGAIDFPSHLRKSLYDKGWVVYAKRPFATPDHVIEYLGRYTHKIAISNYRIIDIKDGKVFFKWKNYRHSAQVKIMELSIREFIRRLAMHILPHKFVRIRHFGILSCHGRSKIIPMIQENQDFKPESKPVYNLPVRIPCCRLCKCTDLISYPLNPTKSRSP